MQRTLDAGSVVVAERADAGHYGEDLLLRHLTAAHLLTSAEARLGRPPQVEDDLQQPLGVTHPLKPLLDVRR